MMKFYILNKDNCFDPVKKFSFQKHSNHKPKNKIMYFQLSVKGEIKSVVRF